MESQRIVIVGADPGITGPMANALAAQGYIADVAEAAPEAISAVRNGRAGAVVIDRSGAGVDGLEAVRRIREFSAVPVILYGSTTDPATAVAVLDAGADDYWRLPMEPIESVARVRALLRRAALRSRLQPPTSLPTINLGPLKIDFSAQRAWFNGEDLELGGKELHLLYVLAANAGKLISRGHLFQTVWGNIPSGDSKTLDVHVSKVRKKLDVAGSCGQLLKTVRNRGYLLSSELSEWTRAAV